MTSFRSSVRPKSSKQEWGTILKPEFGLGYQKMNVYEIDQTVDRLAQLPEKRERVYEKPKCAKLDKEGRDAMVERLSAVNPDKVMDSRRTQKDSSYRDMGVLNSFAWKGYN